MKKTMLLFACALMLGSPQVQAKDVCDNYLPGDFDHDGDVDYDDIDIHETTLVGNQGSCGYPYFSLCTTIAECADVGGVWWDNGTCNASADPEIKTVASSSGLVWIDRNLGAHRVATEIFDEYAFGDYYQWGRGNDGHQKPDSETTTETSSQDDPGHGKFITRKYAYWYDEPEDWRVPQNDNLWQGESGINNPCPAGFRVPTWPELWAEKETWLYWDGPTVASYPHQSIDAGFLISPLKFTAAGTRYYKNGSVTDPESNNWRQAKYWSSTVWYDEAKRLTFSDGWIDYGASPRANGLSVRCIQD